MCVYVSFAFSSLRQLYQQESWTKNETGELRIQPELFFHWNLGYLLWLLAVLLGRGKKLGLDTYAGDAKRSWHC